MHRLNIDCEELLHWWEPKTDISFIFNFNWQSLHELRDAISLFLASRLQAAATRSTQSISESPCLALKNKVAGNPATPPDLLDYLAEVSPPSVQIRIAENPNCARETLSRLAFSPDPEVRAAIIDNKNTPESCYKRLVHDESPDVRFAVAESPHVPLTSLYTLLKDENPYVAGRAKETLARILRHTIKLASIAVSEESEMRPVGMLGAETNLLLPESSEIPNRQLYAELKEPGCEFISVEIKRSERPPV